MTKRELVHLSMMLNNSSINLIYTFEETKEKLSKKPLSADDSLIEADRFSVSSPLVDPGYQ